MFCSPEIRRPKVEGRKKAEPRSASGFGLRISACGLRASDFKVFGLRVSGLEWPGPTLEQPWRATQSGAADARLPNESLYVPS